MKKAIKVEIGTRVPHLLVEGFFFILKIHFKPHKTLLPSQKWRLGEVESPSEYSECIVPVMGIQKILNKPNNPLTIMQIENELIKTKRRFCLLQYKKNETVALTFYMINSIKDFSYKSKNCN